MIRSFRVKAHERGLLFREGDLIAVLTPGRYWRLDPLWKLRLDRVSTREAWLSHRDLDVIVRSGLIGSDAVVLDLTDAERALVWIDGRFDRIARPGRYVLWRVDHDVRVEVVNARDAVQLVHPELAAIVRSPNAETMLHSMVVEPAHVALVFHDGALVATLGPGTYAFWKGVGQLRVMNVDLRERVIDISGQEIMTADKVTLRMNAHVTYRVADARTWSTVADDAGQALYRAAQLALREVVGSRELDTLLAAREALTQDLDASLRARAEALGASVIAVGIRDVILPGDMKELMNRVTEAKKAAEAALITRREETAAMRMQANTAKILEQSPTLMKLRELEVLEKVAAKSNLTVVVGDAGGLSDRVVKLL